MTATWTNRLIAALASTALLACGGESIKGNAPSDAASLNWPKSNLTTHEYKEWVTQADNGFVRSKKIDAITFKASYVTSEMKAIRSLGVAAEDIELRRKESELFAELEFYQLTITANGFQDELLKFQLDSQEDYQGRVQYYGFYANQDALLVCGGDTINCPVHTWERTYDAINSVVLEFAFPAATLKDCLNEQREMIYTDRVFGNGPIHFRF